MRRLRALAPVLVALVAALPACGDDPVPAPAPAPEPSPTRTTREARNPRPTPTVRPFDPDRVALDFRSVAGGFEAPIGLVDAPDGERRMYVVEQGGRIQTFDGSGRTRTFLDISERISAGGEQGLLGLEFHPRYASNGRFFVNYSDLEGDTVISAFRAEGTTADPSSERVLLTVDQPFANHNGGQLEFGPDGYLYIALGDGGSAGDPQNNGQRLDTLLGKILRIDVDDRSSGAYGIPRDNPFIGQEDVRGEIWAYGLRNPWRFSFDRDTGDLWIADVGQSAFEEVNREPARIEGGLNYGWRAMEGFACYESGCEPQDYVDPVITYSHDFGCSITGGYVYRGTEFPNLRGAYIAGDYCSGNVWAIPANTRRSEDPAPLVDTGFSISSFGEDEAGELYVVDAAGGEILRVVDRRGG
jgi:glucose/arabinose dehydrogenase